MRTLVRAALGPLLLATGLAAGVLLAPGSPGPRIVVACSCVAPTSLAEYAGEGVVIFSGTVTNSDEDGLLVNVDQWYSGAGAARVILISGEFGDSAACGLGGRPPAGTSWLVVGGRATEGGMIPELTGLPVTVNICRPFVDLATPEGQALLAEAVSTFGDGEPVPAASPAGVTAARTAPAASDDGEVSTDTLVAVGVIVTLLAGLGVLAMVLLVAQRRKPVA